MIKLSALLELCRVSNLPTVWTNVLAATVLSANGFSLSGFLKLAVSMSLFYSGGMCLNDVFDANVDLIKRPFRPIPSGKISVRKAYGFTTIFFAAALVLLLFVPHPYAIYPGLLLVTLIIAYDKFHKTHPMSVILMAACRFMIFIVCALGISGEVGVNVALAGSVQFLYTIYISILARYENSRKEPFRFPVVPVMIAGISLVDGIVLAAFESPIWLAAGIVGMALTVLNQRYVRGD